MSRFQDRPSAVYHTAVNALMALGDDAEHAAGEVLSRIRQDVLADLGYKRSSGIACIQRVIGKHCNHYEPRRCHPPSTDHPYLLLKDGKPAVFVSEPYTFGWGAKEFQELADYATQHGLRFRMFVERATHFPGHTAAIWWVKDSLQTP